MVWNYHDDDVSSPEIPVGITVEGLPAKSVTVTHYRIDADHSNSYEAWKKMGSPQNPRAEQITALEAAGQLKMIGKPFKEKTGNGRLILDFYLPGQGVSLLKMDW